jgi:hypothetical protein
MITAYPFVKKATKWFITVIPKAEAGLSGVVSESIIITDWIPSRHAPDAQIPLTGGLFTLNPIGT